MVKPRRLRGPPGIEATRLKKPLCCGSHRGWRWGFFSCRARDQCESPVRHPRSVTWYSQPQPPPPPTHPTPRPGSYPARSHPRQTLPIRNVSGNIQNKATLEGFSYMIVPLSLPWKWPFEFRIKCNINDVFERKDMFLGSPLYLTNCLTVMTSTSKLVYWGHCV